MSMNSPSRWSQIRERRRSTTESRDAYERTSRALGVISEMGALIATRRRELDLTDQVIADRLGLGLEELQVRTASEDSTLTLKTLLEELDLLGIQARFDVCPSDSTRNGTEMADRHRDAAESPAPRDQ